MIWLMSLLGIDGVGVACGGGAGGSCGLTFLAWSSHAWRVSWSTGHAVASAPSADMLSVFDGWRMDYHMLKQKVQDLTFQGRPVTAETAAERQVSAPSKLHRARHCDSQQLAIACIQSIHQPSNPHQTRLVPLENSRPPSNSSPEPHTALSFIMNHFPHGWGRVSSSLAMHLPLPY
jgi:hypothetical protein